MNWLWEVLSLYMYLWATKLMKKKGIVEYNTFIFNTLHPDLFPNLKKMF